MQLQSLLLVVQVLLAISLISLILLQQGRGAQAGAAFGSGASSTVFGARGAVPFLVKLTSVLAVAFFINSLGLAYLSAKQPEQQSLIDRLQTQTSEQAAVEPGAEQPAEMPADGTEAVPEQAADKAGVAAKPATDSAETPQPAAKNNADDGKKKSPADLPPTE